MCRTDTWWAVYREILQTGHVEMVQTVEELVWGAHDKLIFGRIWVASQLRQTLKVIRNGWKAHTCFCLSRLKNCHTKWVKWYPWVSLIFVIQSSTLSHVNTGTLHVRDWGPLSPWRCRRLRHPVCTSECSYWSRSICNNSISSVGFIPTWELGV